MFERYVDEGRRKPIDLHQPQDIFREWCQGEPGSGDVRVLHNIGDLELYADLRRSM